MSKGSVELVRQTAQLLDRKYKPLQHVEVIESYNNYNFFGRYKASALFHMLPFSGILIAQSIDTGRFFATLMHFDRFLKEIM